jgi:hypothetical protein
LTAICGALDVPLSEVLTDAGERMAVEEHVDRTTSTAATIDVNTKVVIPHVSAMAVA